MQILLFFQTMKLTSGVMTILSTTARWCLPTTYVSSCPGSWTASVCLGVAQSLPAEIITSTSDERSAPASSCRSAHVSLKRLIRSVDVGNLWSYHAEILILILLVDLLGGSFGAHRSLPHSERQPGGPAAPIHSPGPQAWVGALQWVCSHHQELHPNLHRYQTRVVCALMSEFIIHFYRFTAFNSLNCHLYIIGMFIFSSLL